MSFRDPITVEETLDKIQRNKYLLPAIQREFVWKSWQIEKLFDSLMNGYPFDEWISNRFIFILGDNINKRF